MTEPIFVLGCHRSGTSVVAGLLYNACGVSMGELMPPTEDNPLGYFETIGVVDAHRDLLSQMERDWTCPPSSFRPELFDLTALHEQIDMHKQLPGVWAMKDPRSMFLLPAWSHLGVDRVRLIAVVRPTADTVRSIEKRDHIRQDRAEAIVEAHLLRLSEIADQVPLPIVHFPGDGDSLIRQVRDLAAALDLPWDEDAARDFFDETLVRNRSPLRDSSPIFDSLVERSRHPSKVPAVDLSTLTLASEPRLPLETHLSVRHGQQREELWQMAQFGTVPEPRVVEVLLEGARLGGKHHPGVTRHQIQVKAPLAVGATMMREGVRPDALIAHGLLAGRSTSEIEYFFRSAYVNTHPLAELLVDAPDLHSQGLSSVSPPPIDQPSPDIVEEIAIRCGWDHVVTSEVSPGRSGLFFRKRVSTDSELIPVITGLIASLRRVDEIEERLASIEDRVERDSREGKQFDEALRMVGAANEKADAARQDLNRMANRRSVRLALTFSRLFRPLFKAVRSWTRSR
jgi:hypothetical protein